MQTGRREHWERVYHDRQPTELSWYQTDPAISVALLEAAGLGPDDPVLDVGAGASPLVERLLARGFTDLTVLDIAEAALVLLRSRLGADAERVAWIRADVTQFSPPRRYALWHDRAVFHFMTEPADRQAYVEVLAKALRPGGYVIIATFAADGPPRCSGLDVVRYDVEALSGELGTGFRLLRVEQEQHETPSHRLQHFQYCLFQAAGS
jgi:SAM-dependent methyltransferase